MRNFLLLIFAVAALSVTVPAHAPFTLVSSEKRTIKESELATIEKTRTEGKIVGSNLSFSEKEIRIVVLTGPEDDMLSYRVQGIRNPNFVVPAGALLKILFINVDADMRHDIRFGHVTIEFPAAPDLTETAGTTKLTGSPDGDVYEAEEIAIKANENGAYKYFCSVRGHAKGGMWGNVFVGVKPGENVKTAPKTEHIHSADEDKDDHEHAAPSPSPVPTALPVKKKPDEHADHQRSRTLPNRADVRPVAEHQHRGRTSHSSTAEGHPMRSSVNIALAMSREGSGTSWIPDTSPVFGHMKMFGDGGMLMLHGTAFVRYKAIGSSRDASIAGKGGRNRLDAPSMFMAMYSKPLTEASQIGLRAMLSLDPLIERGYGYPLLYQSGELFRGEPVHDRQHPHDFVSELAATYSYQFDDDNSFFVYGGLPGEPAIGPPMYLHRPSGMNNPDAPIGHHWQDATHIAFGVVTAGFAHDNFMFEASAFNGTEPDENRWAFDPPKLNSFSGRFSFNPTKEWAVQISHGYLKYPERAEPDLKVIRRTTASALYNKSFAEDRRLANAFVWGRNSSDEGNSNSFLFESNYEFDKNAVFGRLEQVQKTAHELALESPHPEGNFLVGAYSMGYLREVVKDKGVDVGLGGMATVNTNPAAISSFYGGTTHGGWQLFVRMRPSRIN